MTDGIRSVTGLIVGIIISAVLAAMVTITLTDVLASIVVQTDNIAIQMAGIILGVATVPLVVIPTLHVIYTFDEEDQ